MQIVEVTEKKHQREFIEFPVRLYKNQKNWIRPLDKDIETVFDPEENKFFRHGEATRFLLLDDHGKTIGRVAAFINRKTAKSTDQITGGMGFFECINDKSAAFKLFDTCKDWLEKKGMEAMDGPINFGERDKWWGLHVKGDIEPNYCMPYHFGYYKVFFEEYGWKVYFEQYTYHMPVDSNLPQMLKDKAERISRDPLYTFEHIRSNNLEKYAEDFRAIYNKAWVKHGVPDMPKAQAMSIMNQLKPVLDEEIVWFAYYDGVPVGFFIMIPEANQIFKHLNGKHPLDFKKNGNFIPALKFLWHKWRGTCKKMFGVAFGIVPEFQGRGLEGAIVMAAAKLIQPKAKYTDFEMNWIGSFNPKMIHICESVGATVIKTHYTYRYLFDRNAEFKPHPPIQ